MILTTGEMALLISTLMRLCFTFLGEKILGIYASHYEFAWDTPQQLNYQRYMVYAEDGCKRRGTRRTTDSSDSVPVRGSLWGAEEEEERGWAAHPCSSKSRNQNRPPDMTRDGWFLNVFQLHVSRVSSIYFVTPVGHSQH